MPLLRMGWYETAAVAVVAILLGSATKILEWRQHCQAQRQDKNGKLEIWARSNWRSISWLHLISICVAAPLVEELLFRGPIILIALYINWWVALWLGIILNLIFGQIHQGSVSKSFSDRIAHQLGSFVYGLVDVGLALVIGSLALCVIEHAFSNYRAKGKNLWQGLRTSPKEFNGGKIFIQLGKTIREITIPPKTS